MMPYGLGLDLDGIFAAVAACRHLLDELMHLFCGHSDGFDPSHLAAMNAMVAFRLVDSHDGVLGLVLAVSITQVEQISKVEAIAHRPLMVDHGLYQIVLAFQLLEGEYAVEMNHNDIRLVCPALNSFSISWHRIFISGKQERENEEF